MIDFAALTLGPTMAAFARPVTVLADGARPAFDARGIWAIRPVDVALLAEGSLNTQVVTLGIRLSDWEHAPAQLMHVRVPAVGSLPDEGTFWIDDIDPDGQGGAKLTLKAGRPPR